MFGADSQSPSILGLEVGATVVRAVVLQRETSEVTAAAEAGIDTDDEDVFDSNTIRPALGEVMYQLAELAPESMLAAISIGPPQSGVGSGPALPPWLERQARTLGQNLICAGELGVAFCPQTPVDLLISLCEEAAITVARVDLAPVAAARLLAPGGADTVMLGSGRGWRARLRNDEVLEALHTNEIDIDQPMSIVQADGRVAEIAKYHGVGVAPALDEEFELNLGQLAPAVGAALGLIDMSPANLLDGATVVGRAVPAAGEHSLAGLTGEPQMADGGSGVDAAAAAAAAEVATNPGEHQIAALHGGADNEAATAQHTFDVDDLAPLETDDDNSQAAAGYTFGTRDAFVPGSGDERTTVDLARASMPTPNPAASTSQSAEPFDDSPMLIERHPSRSPGIRTGEVEGIERIGDDGRSRSFPIMLAVLLILIAAVAIFLVTR